MLISKGYKMQKLLTPHEMADYLGVKLSTIYNWTHLGFIPYVKLGKFIRFDITVIKKWIEQRSTKGRLARKLEIDEYLEI